MGTDNVRHEWFYTGPAHIGSYSTSAAIPYNNTYTASKYEAGLQYYMLNSDLTVSFNYCGEQAVAKESTKAMDYFRKEQI